MATRRPPLANVPNATNSPHNNAFIPSKRPRTQGSQYELANGQPPFKKQLRDDENVSMKSPSRKTISHGGEGKVFTRKNVNAPPTAFERKLVAAREKDRQSQAKASRSEKQSGNTRDNIVQWQRHYRKAFPQFVFYFEGMTTEVRNKCSRQVHALGASEEKFFSRYVTHVVTGRPIPQDLESPNTEGQMGRRDGTLQTVNPSLLDKHHAKDASSADILYKAREMGMKIWALEKLQRMISTMNDTGAGTHHGHDTRSRNTADNGKSKGNNELSQVLRNEKINGPSDRDPSAMWKEMILFKGPFIYVHDAEEKTRPAIVREYPKVSRRQDGIWPQFRSAPLGKCPFIDEPLSKKELERAKAVSKPAKENKPTTVTRSKPAATENKNMDPPERSFTRKVVEEEEEPEMEVEEPEKLDEVIPSPKQANPPRTLPTKPGSPKKSSESVIAPVFPRPNMYFRGEPAASGVQPSNITSAIRSQMISSTAAAPGGKAGTSKEVHELKRKVLEKSNGNLSMGGGISSSHRMTDIAGTFKTTKAPVTRLAKAKAQKKLDNIDEEDAAPSDEDGAHRREAAGRKRDAPKKKETRRDPKPGYCENCRDKFDDFEEHVMTRKHRKFAANRDNWGDLDSLLWALERQRKAI
ncbi:hypothetical protein FQN54_001463 [Arachnomyces sp. PD_36]|nr:hypothetical protein FQN54_001463 [Arachnomyces sp. PD_36]